MRSGRNVWASARDRLFPVTGAATPTQSSSKSHPDAIADAQEKRLRHSRAVGRMCVALCDESRGQSAKASLMARDNVSAKAPVVVPCARVELHSFYFFKPDYATSIFQRNGTRRFDRPSCDCWAPYSGAVIWIIVNGVLVMRGDLGARQRDHQDILVGILVVGILSSFVGSPQSISSSLFTNGLPDWPANGLLGAVTGTGSAPSTAPSSSTPCGTNEAIEFSAQLRRILISTDVLYSVELGILQVGLYFRSVLRS